MVILFVALLAVDQATKYWALGHAGSIGLDLAQNTGIAFGLFQNKTLAIIALNILFLGALWFFRQRYFSGSAWQTVGLWFVLAGGSSNCLDRIFRGYVVDFLHLGPIPTFNVADVWVNVGVALLIIHALFISNRNKSQP